MEARDWGQHPDITVGHDDTFTLCIHLAQEIVGNRKGNQGLETDVQVSGPVVPGQDFISGKFPAGNRLAR